MIASKSAILMAFILTFKRSWMLNFIIWSVYLGIIFTPLSTIAASFIYRDITQDGFAGIGFLLLFIPLEIIAILMFAIGCIGGIRGKRKKYMMFHNN
ncbi:hypothetical protein [Ureibacillus sp. FSL E2-3493]|uniref:hypothetical protein n=1 Tax=Ureibacillus sp. FSL E2-3493 TaxID=2921367 RepID=UPI0031199C65